MQRWGLAAGIASALLALAAPGAARGNRLSDFRKAPGRAFALDVQRVVLPNGLVVLLAPDPAVSSVAVWMTFRAGAQHAPEGKSGLAHLVEHVMASGPTPDTDYAALLERRGARWFNATTTFDAMSFEAVVPAEELPAALWMVNITDETRPIPVSCFQLPDLVGIETPLMTACHQPVETIVGNEVPAAWFASGLRVIDIANPLSMKQAAWWMPDVPSGAERVCSNDVYVDHRGLIYLIDRNRGLSILERV